MHTTTLHFPDIQLQQRDGHKLRGYFANLFGEESDLFHNHGKDGQYISRYPKIQYKVVRGKPMLIGIEEGAHLITERFLRIDHIDIDGLELPVYQKNLKSQEQLVRVLNVLYTYEFVTPWQGLNQDNYKRYMQRNDSERKDQLHAILINNMISFFKAIQYQAVDRIMVTSQLKEIPIQFKSKKMLGFKGQFTCNVQLPDYIGLGKSVSRGFGTIKRIS